MWTFFLIFQVGQLNDLPQTVVDDYEGNEEFLRKAHHVLLEVEVISGELVCPETGRKFPVNEGIPNMLANEDEVWDVLHVKYKKNHKHYWLTISIYLRFNLYLTLKNV